MRAGMLALTGCVIILYSFGALPAWYGVAGSALLLLAASFHCGPERPRVTAVALAVLLIAGWVIPALERAQPQTMPVAALDQPVQARGYPCTLPGHSTRDAVVFVLCVRSWSGIHEPIPEPARVRLRIPDEPDRFRWQGPLSVELSLRAPVGFLNHGGEGGYERWLYRHGIDATARVHSVRHDQGAHCPVICRYHRARQGLLERIENRLERMGEPALVEALMLGSRERLSNYHWEILEATGTNHLVAISGLHVGLVALIVGWPLKRALVPFSGTRPALARWLPLLGIWSACLGYALLAGFTIPTQRALVMVMVASYVLASGRQWRLWDGWLLALVLVLLVDPRAPLDMGFWLSFGAVACLLLVFGGRIRQPGALRALLMAQVAVIAGLWPALQAFGREATLTALPANLFAIPALSLFLMPVLMVGGALVLVSERTAAWVEPGLDLAFTLFWQTLVALSQLDGQLPSLPFAAVFAAAMLVFLLFMPITRAGRAVAVGALVAALSPGAGPVGEGVSPSSPAQVLFPDGVGGSVAVVRSGESTLVFDARPPGNSRRDQTRDRLLPWLARQGIARIDALVLSHPGAEPDRRWRFAAKAPSIGETVSGEGCRTDEGLILGNWRVRFWRDPRETGLTLAEHSCNLVLRGPGTKGVLFGPIRRSGERRLLRWLQRPQAVDWVMAPREGIEGSSQQGLVEALAPRLAVFAATEPFVPAERVYRDYGSEVANVARGGEVRLREDRGRMHHSLARDQVPFWLRGSDWMNARFP